MSTGSRAARRPWLRILGPLPPRRRLLLNVLSFLLPLSLWSAVSYLPCIWHPMVRVADCGDASCFSNGELVDGDAFAEENARIRAARGHLATGWRANPVCLPPPHAGVRALVTGFTTAPARPDEPWLYQGAVAQHHHHLLGLRGLVAGRCAARDPGRRAAGGGAPDGALHRVLSLLAGAGVRGIGGGGAWHPGRAEDRHHLRGHVLPAGAGHREHHPAYRSGIAGSGSDAGGVAAALLFPRRGGRAPAGLPGS